MLNRLLIFVLFAFPIFAQAPAFTSFGADVQQVTVGTEHCTIWAKLPGAWPTEVACYSGTTVTQIQVALSGAVMEGSYKTASGTMMTWMVQPTGAWELAAQTSNGIEGKRQGVF